MWYVATRVQGKGNPWKLEGRGSESRKGADTSYHYFRGKYGVEVTRIKALSRNEALDKVKKLRP